MRPMYTEAVFSTEYLTLKSFKENNQGEPVLLDELVIKLENVEHQLKEKVKGFPKSLKIALEPEELVFKNIKSSLKDEKLLGQAIPFESRKYFRISGEEMIFTWHIWEKGAEGAQLSLLGLGRKKLDRYQPLLQAGFIPRLVIKDFLINEKGPLCLTKKLEQKKESLRVYSSGSLIAWKVYGSGDAERAKGKMLEYVQSLGLSLPAAETNEIHHFREKEFSFSNGPLQSLVLQSARKGFMRLTAVFASLLILLFIGGSWAQLSVKQRNLKRIEAEIQALQNKYQITDLQSIHKKTDAKGVEISSVLLAAERRFPKDRKVSRFEYKDGEAALTVRGVDVLEANQVKEALENEKMFMQFRIEEGAVTNDKRIVFQVKR